MNGDYRFQNPNEEPGQHMRLALVMVLMVIIIIATQPLLKKIAPPPPPEKQQQTQPVTTPAPAPPAPVVSKPATPAAPTQTAQATSEQDVVIENDLYKITFTNRGAQVKSWVLKKYFDDKNQPLELVNKPAAEKYGYPLSLFTYDAELSKKLTSALFLVNAAAPCAPGTMCDQLTYVPKGVLHAPVKLIFYYGDGDVLARKEFVFDKSYVLETTVSVTRAGQSIAAFPAWPAGFGDQTVASSYAAARIDFQYNDSVERIGPKDVHGGETRKNAFHWGGPVDQYFGAIFLPSNPESVATVTFRGDIPLDPEKPDPKKVNIVLGAAVGDPSGTTHERLFVGPKAVDVLETVHATNKDGSAGPDLGKAVDFGKWFGVIAKPLFLWLKWTQEHWISNWGWAIVLLTVIINIVLFPLRLPSMKSSLKMQKIAPELKAIQDRYAKYKFNDPKKQEMQKEIMALHAREDINMLGGCLPMFIQWPFIVAFYSVLANTIELRHASWLWIRDLSSPDPYFLLPIFMVVTMIAMQRMMPQMAADPAQQKMMNFMMPAMFGWFSLYFAAGLSLYYGTSNLVGMVQQLFMNQTKLGREVREMQLKRARKKQKKP